jgi:hypothetical protein
VIARFRVLLPFTISVRQGAPFVPEEFDHGCSRLKVYAPYQAAANVSELTDLAVPVSDIALALHPADPQMIDPSIIIDGQPTVRANVVQVDVSGPDFDRRAPAPGHPQADDPPTALLFEVVNSILHRLRSLLRSPIIHPIDERGSCWRIQYLTDAEELLPEEKGKLKGRGSLGTVMKLTGLSPAHWQAALVLPREFRTKGWETLLLEAESHLPDLVPAILFSSVALEVLIGNALAVLAPTEELAAGLWQYTNNRDRHDKEPSVADEFDTLLRILTGHSLKEHGHLWTAFMNLKSARNGIVHQGTLTIGGRPITRDQGYDLVTKAKEIANWIDSLLPEGARRPTEIPSSIEIWRAMFANRTTSNVVVTRLGGAQTTPLTHRIVTGTEGGQGPNAPPPGS